MKKFSYLLFVSLLLHTGAAHSMLTSYKEKFTQIKQQYPNITHPLVAANIFAAVSFAGFTAVIIKNIRHPIPLFFSYPFITINTYSAKLIATQDHSINYTTPNLFASIFSAACLLCPHRKIAWTGIALAPLYLANLYKLDRILLRQYNF